VKDALTVTVMLGLMLNTTNNKKTVTMNNRLKSICLRTQPILHQRGYLSFNPLPQSSPTTPFQTRPKPPKLDTHQSAIIVIRICHESSLYNSWALHQRSAMLVYLDSIHIPHLESDGTCRCSCTRILGNAMAAGLVDRSRHLTERKRVAAFG
jgi:hypothetical protein